jgi:hypothetical protein
MAVPECARGKWNREPGMRVRAEVGLARMGASRVRCEARQAGGMLADAVTAGWGVLDKPAAWGAHLDHRRVNIKQPLLVQLPQRHSCEKPAAQCSTHSTCKAQRWQCKGCTAHPRLRASKQRLPVCRGKVAPQVFYYWQPICARAYLLLLPTGTATSAAIDTRSSGTE